MEPRASLSPCEGGRKHRGKPVASSALMAPRRATLGPMTRSFVEALNAYAERERVPVVQFKKERKDDVAAGYRAAYQRQHGDTEGVVFMAPRRATFGVAQEKASAMRTQKCMLPTGHVGPTLVRSTAKVALRGAMVNQYYVYVHDADKWPAAGPFGPVFIKFSSYFPYTGKVCLNGHEYAKRQLEKRGIAFEPLDMAPRWPLKGPLTATYGFRSCADPKQLQAICDELGEAQIQAMVNKWLSRLPQPFTPEDRAAGYTYAVSMLQVECALTQVLESGPSRGHRPDTGRRL